MNVKQKIGMAFGVMVSEGQCLLQGWQSRHRCSQGEEGSPESRVQEEQ